jgi:hypothetical protein
VSGDIVERLRNRAETLGWLNEPNGTREMLLDAADEIERLESQVQMLAGLSRRMLLAGDALAEACAFVRAHPPEVTRSLAAWQEARRESFPPHDVDT